MDTQINFRHIENCDHNLIIQIFRQLIGDETLEDIDIARMKSFSNGEYICLEINNELAGFGSVIFNYVPTKGLVARIEDVIITENMRGRGLGKYLVEHLIGIAKNKDAVLIELTSNPIRCAAQNLYEKLGFEKYDTNVFRLKL